MEFDEIHDLILYPPDETARTEAMARLLEECTSEPSKRPALPGDLFDFLRNLMTRDRAQAAMSGLILASYYRSLSGVPVTLLIRLFPILYDASEPELIRKAVSALRFRSPDGVYRRAGLLTTNREAAGEVQYFYAYEVLANIPYESLHDTFEDYIPDAAESEGDGAPEAS